MHRHAAQSPDRPARHLGDAARQGRPRSRLVERAELVREPGHRAADAGAAGNHAATHVVDRAALDDVALHDGSPASDLDEALVVALVLGEDALLVVARLRAVAVDGLLEQPRRPAELVELRHGREVGEEQEHRRHGLGEVVPDR